jgi:hypothetical protein
MSQSNGTNIVKNNKLIAEFMGEVTEYEINDPLFNQVYNFNSSWNRLMPVVEKIESLGVSTDIHYFAGIKKNTTGYFGTTFIGYTAKLSKYDSTNQYDSKIESVYNAIINFIKYYNQQNK